jgi:hypothetical protein
MSVANLGVAAEALERSLDQSFVCRQLQSGELSTPSVETFV